MNVLRLLSSLPSRYHARPSSPPPRGCTSAHTIPDRAATAGPPRTTAASTPRRSRSRRRRTAPCRRSVCRRAGRRRPAPRVVHRGRPRPLRRVPVEVDVRGRRLLAQDPLAGHDVVVVHRRRRGQRLVREPHDVVSHSGLAPSSTSWGSVPKSSTLLAPVAEQHPHPRLGVAPLVDDEVTGERLGRRDPSSGLVGEQLLPLPGGVDRGATITRKSGASRLVSTTNRSPQWSIEYSTSGTRARTMRRRARRVVGGQEPRLRARLAVDRETIHCSLRELDTSR